MTPVAASRVQAMASIFHPFVSLCFHCMRMGAMTIDIDVQSEIQSCHVTKIIFTTMACLEGTFVWVLY